MNDEKVVDYMITFILNLEKELIRNKTTGTVKDKNTAVTTIIHELESVTENENI